MSEPVQEGVPELDELVEEGDAGVDDTGEEPWYQDEVPD